MDRIKRETRGALPGAPREAETGKVLPFVPRVPRAALADHGEAWYHRAAIEAEQGPTAKR